MFRINVCFFIGLGEIGRLNSFWIVFPNGKPAYVLFHIMFINLCFISNCGN
jgi:hypothetical protein